MLSARNADKRRLQFGVGVPKKESYLVVKGDLHFLHQRIYSGNANHCLKPRYPGDWVRLWLRLCLRREHHQGILLGQLEDDKISPTCFQGSVTIHIARQKVLWS